MDVLVILSRFVHFAALCLLAGGALFRLIVAPVSLPRGSEIGAAALAVLSALGWLAAVAAGMTGDWLELLDPDTLRAVLTETRFGELWCIRFMLLAAMLGSACMPRTRRADALMLGLSGAALVSLAGAGHGVSGHEWLGIVHAVADMLHLLGAAAWLGGLVALACLLGDRGPAAAGNALPRFSQLGYAAVITLVLTGCINTASLLEGTEQLLSTEYGRLLLTKLGLVAAMVAIAIGNRLLLAPRLSAGLTDGRNLHALRVSVAVEQMTGLAVLATVAFLGTVNPDP